MEAELTGAGCTAVEARNMKIRNNGLSFCICLSDNYIPSYN